MKMEYGKDDSHSDSVSCWSQLRTMVFIVETKGLFLGFEAITISQWFLTHNIFFLLETSLQEKK